jgi:hypothetical protein
LPHSALLAYDYASSKKPPLEVDHAWVDSLTKYNDKSLWIKPHLVPPSDSSTPEKWMSEPFWAARKEAAGDDIPATLVLSEMNSAGSHTTTAKGDPAKRGNANSMQWAIPVLTNPKALKNGDELWWAYGSVKKRKEKSLRIDLAGAKKSKISDTKE